MITEFKYLKGLNTLRFFAAFFVIISHANISLIKLGIYADAHLPVFNRGEDAVNFFFTLSGFLITYLMLIEKNKTGSISIRQFYLRRVFRIWPLYFLITLIGFILFSVLYQKIYGHAYFTFPALKGLLFFICFLPNYIAVNYQVGLLYPLWSIGVEEQFYLFWAPLIAYCKNYILPIIIGFAVVTTVLYSLVFFDVFHFPLHWQKFFITLKYFEMAIGSLFAYLLFYYYEWYNGSVFTNKIVQAGILLIILWHFTIGFSFSSALWFKIICCFLYGLLILNVSVIKNKLIHIDQKALNYLGVISYGLYMYHMLVDYFLRTFCEKYGYLLSKNVLVPLYFVVLLAGTILVASFSYKYFERYFLGLKAKLHPVAVH